MITLLSLLIACKTDEVKAPTDAVTVEFSELMPFGTIPTAYWADGKPAAPEVVELGRSLFMDPKLSASGKISCNSCHDLSSNGADKVAFSLGHEGHPVGRNSPTVFNAAGHVAQFWDGRAKTVEEQALGPILAPGEMAMPSSDAVIKVLKDDPTRVEAFKKAFPGQDDPVTFQNVGVAIGAFERTLSTPSRWDAFLGGDQAVLTNEEKQGFKDFVATGCGACHSGELLGGQTFMKLGVVSPWPNQADQGKFDLTKEEADRMVFKVPSLRNVADTAPYFHDGSAQELTEAVRLMAHHQLGKDLTAEQTERIATWLHTTSGKPK